MSKLIKNATSDDLKKLLRDFDKPPLHFKRKKDIVTVPLKRLTTFDGLAGVRPDCKIGENYHLDITTIQNCEVTNTDGRVHHKIMIDAVDIFGRSQGLIYAELFFDDDDRFIIEGGN